VGCFLPSIVTTDGGWAPGGAADWGTMPHDKIKAAIRRRMARTGEPYATARRKVIAERKATGREAPVQDAVRMSDSPWSPKEIRAAAAAHDELGPEYSDAVVASFLEKVEQEITARVDARVAGMRGPEPEPPTDPDSRRTLLKGIVIGIAITGILAFAVGGNDSERLHRLVWVLLVLAVICAAGAGWAGRQLESRRGAGRQRPRATAVSGHDR
jgi:hypothetical protein